MPISKKITLESSVSVLSGVGATRQKQLEKIGIATVKDLIYYFPRAYERRGNTGALSQIRFEAPQSVILNVASSVRTATVRRGLTLSKFKAFDESGSCEIVFFNSPFVKDVFHVGDTFRFYGKCSLSSKRLQFINPKYEKVLPNAPLPFLVPVYPLTEKITLNFMEKIISSALENILPSLNDPLPNSIRIKNSLPVLSYAIKNIHFPESEAALSKAIARLAFDEILLFGIGIALSSHNKKEADGIPFAKCDISNLTSLLPYELTSSQKNVINDIYRDTVLKGAGGKCTPMSRIIVGDVGSGKTICAIAAMLIAVNSGYQAALMAPTEILAKQHYDSISKIFDRLNIHTVLLTGSTTQKEKARIYGEIKSGVAHAIVGTHALITDKVVFSKLGLVITDEQHRFGIAQRALLKEKNREETAHLLVMSATPIPRTLALTAYGDLDISKITEMPHGRERTDTFVIDESYRTRLNSFIEKQVENGGQCYIICPAIEPTAEEELGLFVPDSIIAASTADTGASDIKNVVEYTENLRQCLPKLRIEQLHGKMKPNEKNDIMTEFSKGNIDVLVSTTVIEVGINVPNASLMIVENAERFGLAQLHQLRGRVGRGTRKSYCVLVSGNDSEKSKTRLEIIKNTYDGYEIAEKDLVLRGPGDFFASISQNAVRQSGGLEFKLAELCDDSELFKRAFGAANEIVKSDPKLLLEEHKLLHEEVKKHIAPSESTIS